MENRPPFPANFFFGRGPIKRRWDEIYCVKSIITRPRPRTPRGIGDGRGQFFAGSQACRERIRTEFAGRGEKKREGGMMADGRHARGLRRKGSV